MRLRDDRRPIAVFDSGLGGLTVFKAIGRRMPGEDLVYFGDTAHIPYGTKSREAVTRYSLHIARFLESLGIKALVVACNTASALALPEIQKAVRVPVVGVIHPGARGAADATRSGRVGVIGTEATIASGAYAEALKEVLPGVRTVSAACPLFVPLVEEGWWGRPVAALVAKEYLTPMRRSGVDTLILGCTHYPLLKRTIQGFLGPSVKLIDSAEQTAIETEELLVSLKVRARGGRGRRTFFVSDAPKRFLKLARRLLGVSVSKVSLHRFD